MKDKKYITTDKHPDLKEGVIFKKSKSRTDMYVSSQPNDFTYISDFDSMMLIEEGYIKEVQEPEFTKDDMIAFCVYTYSLPSFFSEAEIKKDFEKWLNKK